MELARIAIRRLTVSQRRSESASDAPEPTGTPSEGAPNTKARRAVQLHACDARAAQAQPASGDSVGAEQGAWSRGLYGRFLPERRHAPDPTPPT